MTAPFATPMVGHIVTEGSVKTVSRDEWFVRVFGHAPKSKAEREAEAEAYWADYRKKARAELLELRERLCKQASPSLQAKFRAQWAEEDAKAEARELRRAAA